MYCDHNYVHSTVLTVVCLHHSTIILKICNILTKCSTQYRHALHSSIEHRMTVPLVRAKLELVSVVYCCWQHARTMANPTLSHPHNTYQFSDLSSFLGHHVITRSFKSLIGSGIHHTHADSFPCQPRQASINTWLFRYQKYNRIMYVTNMLVY